MKKSKGFTLIELVIVIVIIGILAIIAVPLYRGYTRRAMASEGQALLGGIAQSEKAYFAEHNAYLAQTATSGENTVLSIDPRTNRYFTQYTITIGAGTGTAATFTASTVGSGDAAGITLRLSGSPTAAAARAETIN